MSEESFLREDPQKLLNDYKKITSSQWQEKGAQFAIELFHQTAHRVPAYIDFLKKNEIDPDKIKTLEDFKLVPLTNKENYLKAYPLTSLCWDGKLDNLYTLSSSSGSTGNPFIWPRGIEQEVEGARFVELFYKYLFDMDKKSTLYVVSFGMGAWIAGSFMASVTQMVAKKGYPILVVTPGLEKELLITLIKQVKDNFDQVLIIGYPPFVKDILDSGEDNNLDWKKLNLKLMFAAEGFSETWRDYVLNKIGSKNPLKTATNIYGTADAAIMGMETPLSILLKRTLVEKNKLEEVLGSTRQPTIVQFDPTQRFFEKVGEELVFTSHSGLPLVRYNIHDTGDILNYNQAISTLRSLNVNVKDTLQKYNCKDFDWKLPFVYIYGRSDFTVNFYGLGIFPEHIKSGLEDIKVSNLVTGKFTIYTETDKKSNQKLLINIELQKEILTNKNIKKLISDSIVSHLKELNSEYNKLSKEIGALKSTPVIKLFPYSNEQFRIKAKHKWVKKS